MASNELQKLIDLAGARNPSPAIAPLPAPQGAGAESPLAQTLIQSVTGTTAATGSGSAELLTTEIANLRQQITELSRTATLETRSLDQNTQATLDNTTARGQGASAGLEFAKQELLGQTGLGSMLLSPLVSGLMHLFGGGGEDAPTSPTKAIEPPPVRLELATPGASADAFAEVRRGASETPERVPQVTINVNAIDSRSFLDHSDAIAHAVRTAMLNMNGLNDVVGDL